MKCIGSYEAKTHLSQLLRQVERGQSIMITKSGRPIARLVPVKLQPQRDVKALIAEFRAYSQHQARTRVSISNYEIKEMLEEGRP